MIAFGPIGELYPAEKRVTALNKRFNIQNADPDYMLDCLFARERALRGLTFITSDRSMDHIGEQEERLVGERLIIESLAREIDRIQARG